MTLFIDVSGLGSLGLVSYAPRPSPGGPPPVNGPAPSADEEPPARPPRAADFAPRASNWVPRRLRHRKMAKPVVAAIDQGTQSTRVFLYDASTLAVLGSHQVELGQHRPHPGWVEHDPDEIVASVHACLAGAVEAAGGTATVAVRAVGVTNQRETTVAWDGHTGRPLHRAVVWNDGRTAGVCQRVEAAHGGPDCFRAVTGLPVSPYFSAYKAAWLLEHVPEVASAASAGRLRLGTVDSWLLYNLTGGVDGGVHVTDVTNASRTGLLDVRALAWHAPTCSALGIDPAWLPAVVSSAEVYGKIASGPLAGVPVSGCLGDQQAAVVGQRCAPGTAKNTYGTGCFLLYVTGNQPIPSTTGLLTTVAYRLGPGAPPVYALEGAVAVAGAGVSWLRDGLGVIAGPEESETLAASVSDTGGCYFVPAFAGLLAPRWRPDARGALLGVTASTTAAHVVRALLEAIAWQTREVVDAVAADVGVGAPLSVLRVDGGACRNDLLMQLQADVLQLPVQRPSHMETTSLGAALAAGVGVGLWSADAVFAEGGPAGGAAAATTTFAPAVSKAGVERRYSRWRLAVEHSLGLSALDGSDSEGEGGPAAAAPRGARLAAV